MYPTKGSSDAYKPNPYDADRDQVKERGVRPTAKDKKISDAPMARTTKSFYTYTPPRDATIKTNSAPQKNDDSPGCFSGIWQSFTSWITSMFSFFSAKNDAGTHVDDKHL